MCIVVASEEDVCPYWVQEVLVTHPLEKHGESELGYAEVFITIALVSGVSDSKLAVFHKGAIEDLRDETDAFKDENNWWWELTRRFTGRDAHLTEDGVLLNHSLPEKEARWRELLRRYFKTESVSNVKWQKLSIRRDKETVTTMPGVTTVWPHDEAFCESEKLIKKAYKEMPVVRVEVSGIPKGTWLLRFSFITSDGIYSMGPSDVVFPIVGPTKVVHFVCRRINLTDDNDAVTLMNTIWPGLWFAQWASQAQYDIAGLAPEVFDLTEERLMFPEKTDMLGLIDLNPTRSKYHRFAAYGLYPESGMLEAALRVKPRCYLQKDDKGNPISG